MEGNGKTFVGEGGRRGGRRGGLIRRGEQLPEVNEAVSYLRRSLKPWCVQAQLRHLSSCGAHTQICLQSPSEQLTSFIESEVSKKTKKKTTWFNLRVRFLY